MQRVKRKKESALKHQTVRTEWYNGILCAAMLHTAVTVLITTPDNRPLNSTRKTTMPDSPLNDQDLIRIFQSCFYQSHNTQLVGNALEPLYSPETATEPARIFYTHDYFASALHEIAHWCVAGEDRRNQEDYGYWYEPDGRTAEQQALFEQVEVQPQALEWIFSKACHAPFRVSADNLNNAEAGASEEFKENIYQQVNTYLKEGLPERPKRFTQTLIKHYRSGKELQFVEFQRL